MDKYREIIINKTKRLATRNTQGYYVVYLDSEDIDYINNLTKE